MIERKKVLGNSIALLANRLIQSVTTFVLVAAIARLLGPYELGQYMLAFTYYYVFMTLSSQGLKTLFTRELSLHPEETPIYLVSGTLLQLIFGIIGYVTLVIVVLVLPYSSSTSTVCYIMGLTILPFSLSNITEAIFQGQEKMYLIAISTVPVYILRVLLIIWAMVLKYDIRWVSVILVISESIILLVEWGLITRSVKPKWQIDWDFVWRTVKASRTFLAIEGMAVVKERMQVLILSLLAGEIVVGLYGSVAQLMQPFQIISYSLVIAVFPGMSKAVALGKEKQRKVAESLIEMLLIVALPFLIGLLFFGRDILILVYRDNSFAAANIALNLIAIGLIVSAFNRPLSYALVANGFERINLIEVSISTVLCGFISMALVSQYKLNGAAMSVLTLQLFSCFIYVYFTYKHLFSLRLWNTIRRPLLVSILMVAIFLVLQKIHLNIILTMLTSTLAYALIVGVVGVYAFGGPSVVYTKLLRNKRES